MATGHYLVSTLAKANDNFLFFGFSQLHFSSKIAIKLPMDGFGTHQYRHKIFYCTSCIFYQHVLP